MHEASYYVEAFCQLTESISRVAADDLSALAAAAGFAGRVLR